MHSCISVQGATCHCEPRIIIVVISLFFRTNTQSGQDAGQTNDQDHRVASHSVKSQTGQQCNQPLHNNSVYPLPALKHSSPQ